MFPNAQSTEQQSALFLKKLIAVAISNITYLRAIFPENAFADRSLEGIHLKILRDDGSCPAASELIKWIKSSFEAFDKKYLRQLIMGIYTDPSNPNKVLESYTFHFSYKNNELTQFSLQQKEGENVRDLVKNQNVTSEQIQKATIILLRSSILLTQSLRPLPDDIMITMKLLYYDEVTPPDYEPPCFKPADSTSFDFAVQPLSLNLGDVRTPWHSLRVLSKIDRGDCEVEDAPEDHQEPTSEIEKMDISACSQSSFRSSQVSDGDTDLLTSQIICSQTDMADQMTICSEPLSPSPGRAEKPSADVPKESPSHPVSAVSTTGSNATDLEFREAVVKCPCGVNEDGGLMVLCAGCNTWQHGNCFKILTEEEARHTHYCDVCADADPRKECSDPTLIKMNIIARKALCLFRRALVFCQDMWRVQTSTLARELCVEKDVAQGLICKLEKEGILKPTRGKGSARLVDKLRFQQYALPRYLSKNSVGHVEEESGGKEEVDVVEISTDKGPQEQCISRKMTPSKEGEQQPPSRRRQRAYLHNDRKVMFNVSTDLSDEEHVEGRVKRRKASTVGGLMI